MAVPHRKVYKRRETITALPLYFFGNLQKKTSKERDFKTFYAELRGSTLFLYKDHTQETYIERMDLDKLKSKDLDPPYQNKTLSLSLPTEQVQIKADNSDSEMKWRWYILTVINKEVPTTLNLMPGQRMQLEDVLAQEKKRTIRPDPPPRPTFLHPKSPSSPLKKDEPDHAVIERPDCFFDVSREEAEKMLKEHPECGSLILRPSTLAHNYAVTLRQLNVSEDNIKNFRVTSTNAGFVIELEKPVIVPSMNDVVEYFLEKTEYRQQPYRVSQYYDTHFEVPPPPKYISINPSAPKQVPKAQVAPIQRSETKVDPPPAALPDEEDYMAPDDEKSPKSNQKPTNLAEELRAVLKLRRKATHGDEEGETNNNQGASKSESRTVSWGKNSSFA